MIIRVHTRNFKSFEDDTEICFIASKTENNMPDHTQQQGTLSLLRHSAIYGANAAGKTNAINIFELLVDSIQRGSISSQYRESFSKTKLENKERESAFEIQFTYKGKAFAYGFSCILFTQKITGEYLYDLWNNKKEPRLIFSRNANGEIEMGTGWDISPGTREKIKTYEEDFLGDTKRLYLKEINTNKKLEGKGALHLCEIAFEYLTNEIVTLSTNEGFISPALLSTDKEKEAIASLFQLFDTGVSNLDWEKLEPSAWDNIIPRERREDFRKEFDAQLRKGTKEVKIMFNTRKGFILYRHNVDQDEDSLNVLRFRHSHSPYPFSFNEESDGTRRLFEIVGVLHDTNPERTYVIDELNRSLHPMLSVKFVELFTKFKSNSLSQLIFSTHEPLLLEEKTLRRDEIWFVERGKDNTSKIFPLDHFMEYAGRNDGMDYLDGRYGAIPRLKASLPQH